VIPAAANDLPLAVLVMPTGHQIGGKPVWGTILAGYVEVDDNGGTTVPVTITETNLCGDAAPLDMINTLVSMYYAMAETYEHRACDGVPPTTTVDGDPLPAWTPEQWQLLVNAVPRLEDWATFEPSNGVLNHGEVKPEFP
jgi:hypothetical protein